MDPGPIFKITETAETPYLSCTQKKNCNSVLLEKIQPAPRSINQKTDLGNQAT